MSKHSHSARHPEQFASRHYFGGDTVNQRPKSPPDNSGTSFATPPENDLTYQLMFWPLQWWQLMTTPWRLWMTWQPAALPSHLPTLPQSRAEENEADYRYTIALPGVAREQISLHFKNGMIALEVARHRMPPLRRAFSLPVYINGAEVRANLQDELLTIIIPKTD